MRQPAAADNIIDSFNIIIITTNIVDLIIDLLLKNKAYSRLTLSAQLENKNMCVH